MITMSGADFNIYLKKFVKSFHKDYNCIIMAAREINDFVEIRKFSEIRMYFYKDKHETPKIGRHGISYYDYESVDVSSFYPNIVPYNGKQAVLKFDADKLMLELDYREDVFYESYSDYTPILMSVTFDREPIERAIKKLLFDWEME